MTKPNEQILNRLENKLSASEAMEVLTICNEYIDSERKKIKAKAVNGWVKLISDMRKAQDSKNETQSKKLENQVDRTLKKNKEDERMRKPNLTNGKWIYDGVTCVFTNDNDDEICQLEEYYGEFKNEQDANGKAISAVPDMIQSLLGAKKCLESCNTVLDWEGYEDHERKEIFASIERIEKTLKKAGCTDD